MCYVQVKRCIRGIRTNMHYVFGSKSDFGQYVHIIDERYVMCFRQVAWFPFVPDQPWMWLTKVPLREPYCPIPPYGLIEKANLTRNPRSLCP